MFSRRTLVCPRSCSQDPVLKIRECALSFSSMVSYVASFSRKREDSEEVMMVLGSV